MRLFCIRFRDYGSPSTAVNHFRDHKQLQVDMCYEPHYKFVNLSLSNGHERCDICVATSRDLPSVPRAYWEYLTFDRGQRRQVPFENITSMQIERLALQEVCTLVIYKNLPFFVVVCVVCVL